MKLGQLRNIIKKEVPFWKRLTGDDETTKKIKLFISLFDQRDNQYELQEESVFQLLSILLDNKENQVVRKISSAFFPGVMALFAVLKSENLLNIVVYKQIARLSLQKARELFLLFDPRNRRLSTLDDATVWLAIQAVDEWFLCDDIIKTMQWLQHNKLLDQALLKMMSDKKIGDLSDLVLSLAPTLLTRRNLNTFIATPDKIKFIKFLSQVHELDQGYLDAITKVNKLPTRLVDECHILQKAGCLDLSLTIRLMLLSDEKHIVGELPKLFKLIARNNLLTKNNANKLLDFFAGNNQLDKGLFDFADRNHFLLGDQEVFDELLQQQNSMPSTSLVDQIRFNKELFLLFLRHPLSGDVVNIIEIISPVPQLDLQGKFEKILRLSSDQIYEVYFFIKNMQHYNMLTKEVVDLAFDYIPEHPDFRSYHILSSLHENKLLTLESLKRTLAIFEDEKSHVSPDTDVRKFSRKNSGLSRSKLVIHDEEKHPRSIFVEHHPEKKYLFGGEGFVKKLYATPDSDKPIYKLKKGDEMEVQNAVCINQLLGRQSFWFKRKDKEYLVSQWIAGKPANNLASDDVMPYSFRERLQWLVSALDELTKMHAHYWVHGDINPKNVILSLEEKALHLIDFTCSARLNQGMPTGMTRIFLDASGNGGTFCDDVYGMGFVVATLFPEYYRVDMNQRPYRVVCVSVDGQPMQQKILHSLTNAMQCHDREARCTAGDALKYCQAVLSCPDLSVEVLEKIKNDTIARHVKSFEDVVLRKRHSRF